MTMPQQPQVNVNINQPSIRNSLWLNPKTQSGRTVSEPNVDCLNIFCLDSSPSAYDIWQMSEVGTTLNLIATRRDGKRTMHYCLMFFLLGWLTLGIGWLVWYHKLSSRIGTEQAARGLPVTVTAATYWLWNILGSLIIVGPFIYTYKLLHAMNDLCADYNARG